MKRMLFTLLSCAVLAVACDPMDSNYRHYIDEHQTYSPRVENLAARSAEVGSLTLRWTLPESTLPQTMEIVYAESSTSSETIKVDKLITAYTFDGLKEQGYTFRIYTLDVFGNRSVPVIHDFTPIPHREGNDNTDAGDKYVDDPTWFDLSIDWYEVNPVE